MNILLPLFEVRHYERNKGTRCFVSVILGGKKMCLLCQHAEEVHYSTVHNHLRNVLYMDRAALP